ncbi:MAG: alpha/beta hydrolase [Candidatus Acidiferrales bacterium]
MRSGRRRDRGFAAAFGRLLDEIRNPTTGRAKVIVATLAALAFALLSLIVASVFFLSRALMPLQAAESTSPSTFLGSAENVEFTTPDGRLHDAWFFPGLRDSPVIVLCHGYRSSRTEVMTLATSLQMHRYNVLAFNFAGHGDSPVGYTTMGNLESVELLAALRSLETRTDVDISRVGLWGYSLGGYAVLSAAPDFPGVKAIVVDSVYPSPANLLRRELRRLGADIIPLLGPITTLEFHIFSIFQEGRPGPRRALPRLQGIPKLFIAGEDSPQFGQLTRELYELASDPKELASIPRSNLASMTEAERRTYEDLVVRFFLKHLPLNQPQPARPQ